MHLQVHTVVSQPFEENSYIVHRRESPEALVIDPGLEPDLILDLLQQQQLQIVAILNTHGHADHIAGNAAMKRAFPQAHLLIGANDAVMLTDAWANLSATFGMPLTSPPADRLVQGGDLLEYAGIPLEVLFVPGHSPGHVAFLYRGQPCQLFGGDVLFQSSIGRSDFPGGSAKTLADSIRQQFYSLPDDTIVYPGHGPTTTIGREKRTNPFVSG